MRKKVRKSLAFLLALALVVSVMSGLGLSVSADEAQNEPAQTEEVQDEAVKETPKVEESTPKEGEEEEEADPDAEAVPEEKKDVKKAEGEGSGDEAPVKDTTADPNGEQKDESQAKPAAEEQDAPVEEDSVPVVQADGEEVSEYTITYGDQKLTVKLVDDNSNEVKGIAPKSLTIKKDTATSVNNYVAEVEDYTYSKAYYSYDTYYGQKKYEVTKIAYLTGKEPGWYSVGNYGYSANKIDDDTIYLVYTENSAINDAFTIHYVDENGKEIGKETQRVTVNGDKTIVFNKWAEDILGYTYWRACYDSKNNAEVTKAVLASSDWRGTYYTFYNGSKKLTTPNSYSDSTVEDISELKDIYLVYVKDGIVPTPGSTTGGGGTEVAEPTHNKTAELQADGTYDISLDVSGSVGTDEKKAILDVVYVLDVSGSMSYSMQDDDDKSNEKLEKAKAAIETMTNSLANNNKIAARFSLVKFSRTAQTVKDWTSNANVLNTSLDKLSAGGGTNYEAAFIEAKKLLENKNPQGNASKVVIFVSDGDPTLYSSNAYGNGRNDVDGRAMSRARGVVKTMLPNYLFTVGVGPEKNYSQLSKVTDAAHEGVNMGVTSVNFVGTDENSLKTAFKIMEGSITSIACQNVTISDKLSANVAMVLENGQPKKPVGKVTDKSGKDVGTPSSDGKIALLETNLNDAVTLDAPTYDSDTHTFEWKFPKGYKLEAGYTYTVTANVDVTETAFENYRKGKGDSNPNEYPDKADAGTGTHAGMDGLFSNDNENAKLIYTVTGESEPKEVNYQKPVVRLTPSKLTIKKTVTGLDETALEQLKNNLKFKVTYTYADENKTEKEISFKDFKQESGDTYSYTSDTLDCWSMNATYKVEETDYNVEAYDRTGSGNTTVTGDFKGKNQNETASFTNNYQHKNVTVTIKKEVNGNMSQTSDKFAFSVMNPSNLADGDKSFKLSADDTAGKTISIPYGSDFTIRETPSNGYTLTKVNDKNVNDNSYTIEKVTQNTTIIFTNTKTINPPNGIITTIAPYAIMVVLAAGAGVYFVYSRRRRNG